MIGVAPNLHIRDGVKEQSYKLYSIQNKMGRKEIATVKK